jgi:hypothetical protein
MGSEMTKKIKINGKPLPKKLRQKICERIKQSKPTAAGGRSMRCPTTNWTEGDVGPVVRLRPVLNHS